MDALDKSPTLVDPANLHNYPLRLLFRAEARIQQSEIPEASSIVGDVARLTAGNASQRTAERIARVDVVNSTSATFWALMTLVVSSSRPLTELLVRWRGGRRHVVAELDTVVVRRDLNDHGVELGNDVVSAQCYPMSSR